MLGSQIVKFPELTIDLAPSAPSNDTAFYEAGNICAKYYSKGNLPTEVQLIADFSEMLRLYEALIQGENNSYTSGAPEGDEPPNLDYEDASRFRMHKRIERNVGLVKRVKKILSSTCQVCSTNFELKYGEIGKDYIEAHHLKPISSLNGTKVAMDPATDFAVLCANCHRMIHRSGCVSDIEQFKKDHYRG
jgi:5-methylcytosine-specific restriction protein A